MRFVECVRCELFPVGPNLLEYLLVVAVVLSTVDELGLQLVELGFEFFTHGLAQCVALAACKVGKQAREKHHLLLVHGNAVRVLEVLLHAGNIVLYKSGVVLALNEVGNVVHWAGTVEGVHGNEVLECTWLQFAQVLLHTGRLELECSNGVSLAIELVGLGVVDGNGVDIDINLEALAYVFKCFLYDRQCLQAKEVHFYKAGLLNYTSLVLCHKHLFAGLLVLGNAYRYVVGDIVAANDGSTGVYAGVAHVALEHLCILYGVAQNGVGRSFGLAQLGYCHNCVGKVHLQAVGKTVGNCLAQFVRYVERQFLYACYVLNGELCCHCAVCDNVCHLLLSIFLGYPVEHSSASVVVEVDVDIGQRNTVGVKETLEKQVVFYGVYAGNSKGVGYHAAGCRTTSGAHRYSQLLACGANEVLHNKEVPRETHGLHYMQLKVYAVGKFLREWLGVAFLCSVVGELAQVVALELYTV